MCFAALAGVIWSPQLICLTAGEPTMGNLSYLGWSVLLTSLILFSTGIGIFLGEWKNTSNRTRTLLVLGLACLVASSLTSCYSGYLGSLKK
jgi:L-rhamnose-H+ transport protein